LAHEAFVRLAGRFGNLRSEEAFQSYLRTTVVNLVRMHRRHRAVERAYASRIRVGGGTEDAPTRDVAEYEALKQALLRLPERQRAAIVLRFYEDLGDEQIAEVLRCRPGTVRSLVSRGLDRLRRFEHE
jgi:RNA polymerase sigma factor (sigma-70 family)